jgi:hypothetical protein
VYAPLEVEARDAESIYVVVDGVLDEVLVRPGDKVVKDQPLARLRNIDVEISIARLMGQRDELEAQLEGLKLVSFDDPRATYEINAIREQLDGVNIQLAKANEDLKELTLVAPRDGYVLPPSDVEPKPDETTLATWSGSPFDRVNRGALLTTGALFCQIGEPNRLKARLIIDQDDSWYVHEDQDVEIMLDQSAEYVYASKITELAHKTVKESPPHLSSLNGGPLPTEMGPDGVARPIAPCFQAFVPLPENDPHGLLRIGLIGRAKITTPPRTLWERLSRYAMRTFNFEL